MLELKEIATVKLSDVHGGNAATEVPLHGAINVLDALPESRKYWTWPGSLTTPPCSEGVTWVLLQQTATISKAQVDGMKAGAVIIDLAAEGGGNCEYSQPGETVQVGQVTIVAPLNVPSLLSEHASELYAKNQYNLIELFIKDKAISIDWNDEVLAKTALTHAGEIKNEAAKKAVETA